MLQFLCRFAFLSTSRLSNRPPQRLKVSTHLYTATYREILTRSGLPFKVAYWPATTLGGTVQVAAAHCSNERTLDPTLCNQTDAMSHINAGSRIQAGGQENLSDKFYGTQKQYLPTILRLYIWRIPCPPSSVQVYFPPSATSALEMTRSYWLLLDRLTLNLGSW